MSWGRAFLSAALPALLVGPLSGILGGIMMLVVIAATSGDSAVMAGAAMFVTLIVVVLGLVISTPACTIMGAVLAKTALADPLWLPMRRWLVCGVVAGAIIGSLIAMLFLELAAADPTIMPVLLAVVAAAALLGGVSAYLMWRMLRGRISRLNEVDTAVFE